MQYSQNENSFNSFPVSLHYGSKRSKRHTIEYTYQDYKYKCENEIDLTISNLPLPKHWCTITYFEFWDQIGEFKIKQQQPSMRIDGFTSYNENHRISLWSLTSLKRSKTTETVIQSIGAGIILELKGEGDIWLRNEGHNSAFVHSELLNINIDPCTVHKIGTAVYMKIFDLAQFYIIVNDLVNEAVCRATNAKYQEKPVDQATIEIKKYLDVNELKRYCSFKLSFGKGFGQDYPKMDIKQTPCWLEVCSQRAMQMLDEILSDILH